jgi:hypothetical protein
MDYKPSHSKADTEPGRVIRRSVSADPDHSSGGSNKSETRSSSSSSVYSSNIDPNFILHAKITEESEETLSPDESSSPTLRYNANKKEQPHFTPTHPVDEKDTYSYTNPSYEHPVDSGIDINIDNDKETVGNHIPESTSNEQTYRNHTPESTSNEDTYNTLDQSKQSRLTDGMYVCSLTVGDGHQKLPPVHREETKF